MYPYQKTQIALLLDLVKEANPGMPLPPNSTNIRVGSPAAQTVPSGGIADTNILLSGISNSGYFGGKLVQYRRIDLAKFFKNMEPVVINAWSSIGPNTQITNATICDYLNKTYGLALVAADADFTSTTGPNLRSSVVLKTTSLCYAPTRFDFIWRPIGRPISEALPGKNLAGRSFPGGNNFAPGFKPVGEYMCYETDFSPLSATFAAIGASGTWNGTSALGIPITDFLKANVSADFKGDQPHTVYGGLNGLSFIRMPMPVSTVPEANSLSTVFKNVVAIIAQPDSWFRGKLLMHY